MQRLFEGFLVLVPLRGNDNEHPRRNLEPVQVQIGKHMVGVRITGSDPRRVRDHCNGGVIDGLRQPGERSSHRRATHNSAVCAAWCRTGSM